MSEYANERPGDQASPSVATAPAASVGKHTLVESAAHESAGGGGPQPPGAGAPVQRKAEASAAAAGAAPHGDRVQRLFGRPDASATDRTGPWIQRRAAGPATADPGAALAHTAGSTGAPLPADVQARFGASLGSDLSSVRVHTGAGSATAAEGVGARAFAVGQDIHFAAGQYRPDEPSGVHLLAHEVAHTVQQGGAPSMQTKLEVSSPGDAAEVEADRAADAMTKGEPAAVSSAHAQIARDPEKPQGDPDAGAPETPIGHDANGFANGDGTQVFDSSKRQSSVLETLAKNASVKVTHNAGNYYRVVTPSGKTGYVLRNQLDIDGPTNATDAQAQPAQPANASYQPIIDKAIQGPEDADGEKVWLLDGTFFHDLLTSIPDAQRDLGGIPIGNVGGWLDVNVKPVVKAKFASKADVRNNTGLFTYHGNYLLWRHAIHHNHNPKGGSENTGTYDAIEGYKLPTDIMAKYEAKQKAKRK